MYGCPFRLRMLPASAPSSHASAACRSVVRDERLRAAGVRVEAFTFSAQSVQRLSAALHNAVTSAALRVYPDEELEREVLGLQVVQTANRWRMDHRAGGFSDRAVALAMAVQAGQTLKPSAGGIAGVIEHGFGSPWRPA